MSAQDRDDHTSIFGSDHALHAEKSLTRTLIASHALDGTVHHSVAMKFDPPAGRRRAVSWHGS